MKKDYVERIIPPHPGELYEHFKSREGNEKLYKFLYVAQGKQIKGRNQVDWWCLSMVRDCENPSNLLPIVRHAKGGNQLVITGPRNLIEPGASYVIYQSLYNGDFPYKTTWARRLENFFGFTQLEGGQKVKRFTRIG